MKKSDLQVLSILRNNCRTSLTDIGRKTGIPVSTLYDRLKGYHGSVIRKNVALVDFSLLGYVIRANIIFSVDRPVKDEFAAFLLRHQNVNSVYRINNGYDFMIEVIHRDVNGLEKFLDDLQARFKIREKKVFFIIDEVKRESFLTDESLLDSYL